MLKQVLIVFSIIEIVACSLDEKYDSVHACEGKTLKIECREGELIQLNHANYGRTSITKCNEDGNTDWDVTCMTRKSFRVVHDKCNQQQNCSIVASASTFEFDQEPCPGTVKYLEAHYQCIPRTQEKDVQDKEKYDSVHACEGKTLRIECREGELIQLNHANYGRTSITKCNEDGNTDWDVTCMTRKSFRVVHDKCHQQQNCSIVASPSTFEFDQEPCPGTVKYLEAHYQCILRAQDEGVQDKGVQDTDVPDKDVQDKYVQDKEKYDSVHACEGKTLKIECREGELIQLNHANYGRTSITKCNEDGNTEWDVTCMTRKSFRVVHDKCHQQQNCSIVASASTFKFDQEPCPGTVKYLEAHYQCIARTQDKEIQDKEKYDSVHACEGKTLRIECQEGELIQLTNANYGRTSITKCNEHGNTEWDVNCMTRKSFRVVHDKCNQQQNCSIVASASTFEFDQEPCPGTVKYLEAHYQCVPRTQDKDVQDKGVQDTDVPDKNVQDKDVQDKGVQDKDVQDKGVQNKESYASAYECEGKTLRIECREGELIHLIRANYGRFSITKCNEHGNIDWNVNCISPKSFRVAHNKCHQQQNCSILASASTFEFDQEPCPGTVKYLEAHYQCVPTPTDNNASDCANSDVPKLNCQSRNPFCEPPYVCRMVPTKCNTEEPQCVMI